MDNVDLHPPDDYSHRFFIWHEWIQVRLVHASPFRNSHPSPLPGKWPTDGGERLRLLLAFNVLRQTEQQPSFEDADYAYGPTVGKRGGRT